MIVLFLSNGGYNLYTNYLGTFCTEDAETDGCELNWMSILSLPNKMNDSAAMEIQEYLNLLSCFLIILILMWFRRCQRMINAEIDEKQNSPADYTVIVKNIPTNRDSDYNKTLTDFFENHVDPEKKYSVKKVNLLWELDEIEEIEEKIKEALNKKKKLLVENSFNHENAEINMIDVEVKNYERELKKKLKEIEKSPHYFAGIAFVSFNTEKGNFFSLLDKKMNFIIKFFVFSIF